MADPIVINPTLTLAGQAAAFNASSDGVELKITHVSFGTAHYDPDGDEVKLVSPVGSKIPLTGGSRPTPYQIRMSVTWQENVGQVPIGEIGYWSGDTLVFIWSKADGTIASYKTDGVAYVLFNDLAFAQVPANSIDVLFDPTESIALAALSAHEGAADAHPQYMQRADMAKDSGPLALLKVSGTNNALILTLNATETKLPALARGQRFQFLAAALNTGPVTANVAGLGAIAIKKASDGGLVDLDAGDIKAGAMYDLNYDGAQFQLGGGVGGGGGKAFLRYSFVASVAQSVFTAGHTPGSVIVLRNGREVTDFSSGDGTKITLATPCAVGDSLEVLAFAAFKTVDAYTKAEITALLKTAGAVPVGTMLSFPRGVVPPGYLEADGSVFDIGVYPDLAAYLGGNTLPETRGEFLRGWDHGRGVDAGRAIGALQEHAIADHYHAVLSADAGTAVNPANGNLVGSANGNLTPTSKASGASVLAATWTSNIQGPAASKPGAETRPRNLSVMWCIKAWNAPVNQGTIDVAALAAVAGQSTEVKQGTAKVATQALTDAGADDTTIVTPKKMRWGFQLLKAANGYIVFPSWLGSLKIQWGYAPATTTSTAVVFPVAFTTAPFHLTSHDQGSNSAASMSLFQLTDLTVNGFTAVNVGTLVRGTTTLGAPTSAGRFWLSIGF